jgi:hypothetical protein
LLDDLWNKTFAAEAPNGAVAAVPSRDVLAFCDAKSEQGIQELQALVERVSERGHHLLTKTLYQRVGGQWKRYRPRTHRVDAPVQRHARAQAQAANANHGWHLGHVGLALSVLLPIMLLMSGGIGGPAVARFTLLASVAGGLYGAWRVARDQHLGATQILLWMVLCGTPLVACFASPMLLMRSRA